MAFEDFNDKDVKKRKKPELNERWWKQAWPGERAAPSGGRMTTALKEYKAAKRATSQSDLIDKLKAVKEVTHRLRAEARSKLKDYPKRRDAIVDELYTLDGLIDAEKKSARKIGNGTRVVFSYNFAERVKAELAKDRFGKRVRIRSATVDVELLEAVVQELDEKNLLNGLYGEYSNALDTVVSEAAAAIIQVVEARNGKRDEHTRRNVAILLDHHAERLAQLHLKAPTTVISKLSLNAEMEAVYKAAMRKQRLHIAKSVVLTTASGVAIALPGTQAFAIYGLARNGAGLVQEIVEHTMSIQVHAKLLRGHLATLEKAFANGKARVGSETAGTTVNALLGIDLIPTLDKVKSSFKALKLHTQHVGFKTQKLIDAIMEQMDSCKSHEQTLDSLPEGHRKAKKYAKDLRKTETELDKMLKRTTKLAGKLNSVDRKLPSLGKRINDLGNNSRGLDAANMTIKILVSLGGIASGGLVDATHAVETADACVTLAEKVASVTIAGVGYADELISTSKEVYQMATT